jgi:hypothetical protein
MDLDYQPEHRAPNQTHPLLSNNNYDKLKKVTTIVLPALVTLWLTIANVWNLPNSQEIGLTIGAINTFFGVVLAVATNTYNKSDEKFDGQINVLEGDEKTTMQLELDKGPEVLKEQSEVAFRVVKE